MPQLLLEILSEEIPARMQAKAEADLVKALMDGLTAAGLIPEGIKGFSGPRRLVAVVEGLPVKSADVTEDVIGPKEGAPQPAIDGFLRKAGLSSLSEAHLHEVPKKGRVYVAHVRKPGKQTADVIAALVPQIIRGFHWPKSMRWGSGDLRWVRPISRILCTFDGEVVPFEIEGIKSDAYTEGHRVMGRGPYKVRRFDDYEDVLKNKGRVILDREERKETILTEAKQLCAAQNLELVDDIGLLEEVAGLAEFPVVIIGDMDKAFLDLPPEVIKLSMRTHQKYFAVRDPAKGEGQLAPKFIVVANLDAADGGEKIAAGNSRVLSARLNDARFFWDNDRKIKLEDRFEKLGNIVFHEQLGSVRDKVERVAALAGEIAPLVGADPAQAKRAAKLAKCDLVSDMVGEFPELEGVMGRYYATLQREPDQIADAIRDHYKPKGPSDEVPNKPVAVAVALADKFDTLLGFWSIEEKPTGSRDPFALRRAALGVLRLVRTNNVQLELAGGPFLHDHLKRFGKRFEDYEARCAVVEDLSFGFLEDRLDVMLRDEGFRHDHIQAAFGVGLSGFQINLMVQRVQALKSFLASDDGINLLAGYKRAANILKAEEKKSGDDAFEGVVDYAKLEASEEKALLASLEKAKEISSNELEKSNFAGAMAALATLRRPVDAFFEKVTVNADDQSLRLNRLKLLAGMRQAINRVADFSKIEGNFASVNVTLDSATSSGSVEVKAR